MDSRAVLVFGLSRSGKAAIDLLLKKGFQVWYWDDNEETRNSFTPPTGCQLLAEGPAAAKNKDISLAVMSPGIPPSNDGVKALADSDIETISEIELAWRFCGAPCVVVTGTNGKSSTATLLNELFAAADKRSILCGNIGVPFSQVVAQATAAPDWYVVEASSYQLALSPTLLPKVMVYTNYAPDHLSWHGSEAAYVQAKAEIAHRLPAEHFVVYPINAGPLTEAVKASKAKELTLGPLRSGATVSLDTRTGRLSADTLSGDLDSLTRDLPYQWRLVSCALHATLGVAQALNFELDTVISALDTFKPLEHRLEEAGKVGHVRFINDSKATNIDATQYALRMCQGPLVLILGGRHKGTSYAELLPSFGMKVKAVIALGEARQIVADDLKGKVPLRQAESFSEALELALMEASRITMPSGGSEPTVLFSPACSSFDMFKNFEERGRAFKEWVVERREEQL